MALILDTNVVRYLGTNEVSISNFRAFRCEGGTIHLADGTALELLAQLYSGGFHWGQWERARDALEEILDNDEPIMVGGRELLAAVGVSLEGAPAILHSQDEQRHFARAAWRLLLRATSAEDVRTAGEIARVGGKAYHVGLDIVGVAGAVNTLESEWITAFERTLGLSSVLSAEDKARLNRPGGDVQIAIEQARAMARRLDALAVACSPPASVRLDAMIRVHSLYFYRGLKTKERYNASNRANDVFDLDLLRYLAVPSAICTADKRIHGTLRQTECSQRRWVIEPNDLASADKRRSLRNLRWPVARSKVAA